MSYWDTSAILKLYVAEHDSAYFLDLIANKPGGQSCVFVLGPFCC